MLTLSCRVFIYADMLALFASKAYEDPGSDASDRQDVDDIERLAAHLTNTCLQSAEEAETSVFLLSDLVGKHILQPPDSAEAGPSILGTLSQTKLDRAIDRAGQVVGETFKAALGMRNHFAVSEQSFEIFGIDLLLSHPESIPDGEETDLAVHLLEVNACPDFKQSGEALHGVIERLFEGVLGIAVKPASNDAKKEDWQVGQRQGPWLKCLDEKVGHSDRPW